MKLKLPDCFFIVIYMVSYSFYGQDISLYKQYNGRYDFIFIGNTLNTIENNSIPGLPSPPCTILTSSSATLNLNPMDVIESAYLYWAGSGTGDFDVKLNGLNISAQRKFSIQNATGYPFFSAFADVTSAIKSTGNGTYNFSELDLTNVISNYCFFGGNFGGWALVIVYKNNTLPLNQLNIYDGMQSVPNEIDITLNSLNVIDNQDAKIGFVAWEGDKNISKDESLRINGNLIGNPPLNPTNNAFNGTNSFTGTSNLYNMDLDVYSIQNNINIGDTTAQIQLTSGQDFVMINAIVTKLNSQLPDATLAITTIDKACNSKKITVNYTVSNLNCTNSLPALTPIAIYINDVLLQNTETKAIIPIDGSESAAITLTIPDSIPNNFILKFVVDDGGAGQGKVTELNESNNIFSEDVTLFISDVLKTLENLDSCNIGLGKGIFNFSNYEDSIKTNTTDIVTFYPTLTDLENETHAISGISDYAISSSPTTIFVKVDNGNCFSTTSFLLSTKNCPPTVHNFVSANNDKTNDTFLIDGLRDVYLKFKLSIYNRWGALIWTGNNDQPDWDGYANQGLLLNHYEIPEGTYFYILDLNDPNYQQPLAGYLFLTR
ncbi:T9SS type B sorting domain-containing protein [Flavobacterium psychrotolerans]|uniref:CARDB domain-containing protein n=1 Tax=Flavobacterium psychrotolerans TaxID=2169410 RepID=A0A2U1JM86_9FLAO|nr:gliding motility-associated C-terminal domain-containing protein [Flavobacterium psychrotolerans]PWA06094.1 hypothetical protein DB895_04110 [Flavobacterium psychrotolerans]